MNALDDILKSAHRARLIPTVADSRKEERIVSVLLATLSVVPPFAEQFLERCGVRMGKTSALRSYTEVEFMAADGSSTDRPDGVLSLLTRKARWTALLEAKIDNTEISEEQVHKYAEIARNYGIDAVITLSNQLASLPSHVPYSVPKRLSNRVQCFHMSWISVLTQAALILRDNDDVSREHAFILEEMARYFEHPSSGIKRFDQMNAEWRQSCVLGVCLDTDQQLQANVTRDREYRCRAGIKKNVDVLVATGVSRRYRPHGSVSAFHGSTKEIPHCGSEMYAIR